MSSVVGGTAAFPRRIRMETPTRPPKRVEGTTAFLAVFGEVDLFLPYWPKVQYRGNRKLIILSVNFPFG